jgi:Lrp/AsnC family transcriptional regulator of ectoine degradation
MTQFDGIDLRIIDVLQRQGRLSAATISETVGLSETACYNRLKRIEASGVIEHYGAKLSIKRLMPLQVFFTLVWLENDRPADLQAFERAAAKIPQIVECHYITGSIDYLLKCVTPDFDSYIILMNALREANSNIKRWETSTQVREVKMTAIPLEILGRGRPTAT